MLYDDVTLIASTAVLHYHEQFFSVDNRPTVVIQSVPPAIGHWQWAIQGICGREEAYMTMGLHQVLCVVS